GSEVRRFGTDEAGGFAAQRDFVATGSEANKQYGNGGIGSGRMPGFAQMLTPKMLDWGVAYERDCLDITTYTGTTPTCDTTGARAQATTTTGAKSSSGG